MIKISTSNLNNYKEEHINNLKKEVLDLIPKFPAPYSIDSNKEGFVLALLINPFDCEFLFLKDYYCSVIYIIESSFYLSNSKNINNTLSNKEKNRLDTYFNSIDNHSVFKRFFSNSSEMKVSDLIESVSLLKQFISNKKSTSNPDKYKDLELEIKIKLGFSCSDYIDIRKFFSKLNNLYNSSLFKSKRAELIDALGITVCPYCNRQYIDIYKRKREKDKIAIAQLDHFYPKSDFPLYSVSLYNLVPSCASCNLLKSNKLSLYSYPYCNDANEKNKDKYFELKIKSYNQLIGIEDVDISIVSNNNDIIKDNSVLFHESIYQNHRAFINNLLRKKKLDNDTYRKSINSYFINNQLTEVEFRELLYGFSGEITELLEKPLAKLAYDIIGFDEKY